MNMNDLDVKQIRKKLGLSQKALAKMIEVHWRTVQNWENGGEISHTDYTKICALLPKDNVYYGGEDTNEVQRKGNIIPFYDDVTSIGGINQLGANMNAVSKPTEYIDTGDWFKNATAAIRHFGESMIEYPTGCILAIKEVIDRELIIPGRDYVVETSEYRVTKRIQLGKDEKHFTAYSTNPERYADGRLIHEPFEIPKEAISHIFLVLGYVVKKNGDTIIYNTKK